MHFHRLHVNLRKVIFLEYLVFGLRQHFTPSILRPGREPWHRRWLPRRAFVNDHHHIRASERSSPACAGWLLLAIFLTPSAHPQQCSLSHPIPHRVELPHVDISPLQPPLFRALPARTTGKRVFSAALMNFGGFRPVAKNHTVVSRATKTSLKIILCSHSSNI
jgi:hypothetical protein